MTNHIMYFKKSDDFWALWLIIPKKSDNALLFWLIICDFFSKYNRAVVFNQLEIGNEHTANFQYKMYRKFQKHRSGKKV